MLLKLRTRAVSGVKNDFRGLCPDTTCPLECGETDTMPNILTCMQLLSKHKSSQMSRSNICYEDMFSENLQKQKQVTELYQHLLQIRNEIMSQPVPSTVPVHSSNTCSSIDITFRN